MGNRRVTLTVTALVIAAASCLAWASGSSSAGALAYCKGYPWMENVPRGGMIDAQNHLCVADKGGRNRHYFRAEDAINPPHSIRIAARLHVALRYNGRQIAKSREYVTPTTPVVIRTQWIGHRSGKFCAVLSNHDERGYYRVEKHCVVI